MKLRKMLQNPVALVLQGFAVGGFLFLVAKPIGDGERPIAEPVGPSVLSSLDA
mgnify:CR=1 FL=1|jgi:hypothetical protein